MSNENQMFTEPVEINTTEELFGNPEFPQEVVQSDQQITTTAKLGAIANPDKPSDGMSFDDIVRQNEELIRLGEEHVLRREAALREQLKRQTANNDVAFNALLNGDRPTAESVLAVDPALIEANDRFGSLELQAVEALQNEEMLDDPDYGAAIQQLFVDDAGSTVDILRDQTAKTLYYQKRLDEYRESIKRHGPEKFAKRLFEVGGLFLPLYDTQSRINVRTNEGEEVEFIDLVSAGKTVKRQVEGLWDPTRSYDSFVEEVDAIFDNPEQRAAVLGMIGGTNELAALSILEQYAKGSQGNTGVIFDDTIGFIDSIPFAVGLSKLARGGLLTAAETAKVSGARRAAVTLDADALAKSLKASADADTASEESVKAVRDLIPQALRSTDGTDESIGISGSLAAKLEEIEAVSDALDNITTQGRLSNEQLQELVKRKTEQIIESSVHKIEDVKHRVEPDTKLSFIDTLVGKKAGGGYATESAAKAAATRMGFENFSIAQENGHYFIRQSHVVEELGPNGVPLIQRPDNSAEVIPDTGPIRAGIQNPERSITEDQAIRRAEAEMASVRFRQKVVKPLQQEINKLNRKELEQLNVVMTKGRNEKRWFTVDEFALEWKKTTGKDPSDFHFTAYAAAIKANNIDHQIRNVHLYTERARRGLKTVSINSRNLTLDKVNGKEIAINNIDDLSSMRLYDAEDGIFRTGKDITTEELADLTQRVENGQVKLIRLEESVRVEGDPVNTILVGNRQVDIAPLNRQQLAYVPGGHLLRKTPWFGKQVRRGTYKDGQEYLDSPSTLFAYRTEASGRRHINEVNNALRTYRTHMEALDDLDEAQTTISLQRVRLAVEASPLKSLENLEELINAGRIDYREDIELVFDRGLPKAYETNEPGSLLNNPTVHKLFDDSLDEDGTVQWTRTTGRDYYGKRSEGLTSPHEDKDVVLDPLASISKGLENAAKTHAWDHYITRSMEEWIRMAEPYIDKTSLQGKNDYRAMFYNARLLEQGSTHRKQIIKNLEENRVLLKRTLGVPTPSQEQFATAKRNLARFVEGAFDRAESQGVRLAGVGDGTQLLMSIDDISSNNPINALNGMVFDAWLGMGDLSQLWVQTQTLLTATAASPKYGAQALSLLYPIRLMMVNQSENLLDYVAKNARLLHQQDPKDFKQMVKAFRDNGWNAPGEETAYLANHSNSIGSAGLVADINKVRRFLRFPFYEAERLNRIGAWQIAWKETVEKFPKMDKSGEEFLAIVTKRTNDFSLNMLSSSNAKIQQGIFSPMTRFMGYQMRMLEALLPQPFGGNQFGAAAKGRILASQILLYGSKGLPFGYKISDVAEDLYEQVTGEKLGSEGSKFLESGALDTVLYALSGGQLNTDLAERAGFGRGLDYTFERVSDGSMASALAAYGGPAYSFSSRYAESVRRVMTYFKGTRGPLDIDREDASLVVNELFVKHVNFAKRADKARMIWKMGMVIDQRTGRPLFEASELEAAAAFLGVPLYEETQLYKLYGELDDYEAEVKFNGQLLAKLDREAFRLMGEGEFEKADLVMKQASLILAQYQDDPRTQQDIARFATNELGFTGTQWDSLLNRIQSRLGEDALPPEGLRYEEE